MTVKRKNDTPYLPWWTHLSHPIPIQSIAAPHTTDVIQRFEKRFDGNNRWLGGLEISDKALSVVPIAPSCYRVRIWAHKKVGRWLYAGVYFEGELQDIEGGTSLSGVVIMSPAYTFVSMFWFIVMGAGLMWGASLMIADGAPPAGCLTLTSLAILGVTLPGYLSIQSHYRKLRMGIQGVLASIMPDERKEKFGS